MSETTAGGHSGETDFNYALGKAMEQLCDSDGVKFLPEVLGELVGSGKHADVLVLGPDKSTIAIECEYGKPDKDAKARLGAEIVGGRGFINTTIGVIPPATSRKVFGEAAHVARLIEGKAPIQYAVFSKDEDGEDTKWPIEGYITGTAASLTELAVHLLIPQEKVVAQAERAAETMLKIADELGETLEGNTEALDALAIAMGRPNKEESLRVVGVVWLNAFLFQDRIAERHLNVDYRTEAHNDGRPVPKRVIKAWETVTDINYKSVYDPALEALRLLDKKIGVARLSNILERVSNVADNIQTSTLGVFDIGGELFPRLLSDRSETAAYYTRPEVAEFLAHMAAPDDWQPQTSGVPLVADFACGTGTLLRAGYRRFRAQARRDGADQAAVEALHKQMMETGIAGFDISPIAAHLTASSLSNIQPNVDYEHTNIGVVSVCQPTSNPINPWPGSPPSRTKPRRPKDHATTGSLELLRVEEIGDLLGMGAKATTSSATPTTLKAGFASFDLVLMNPPYSRTRGGQTTFDIAGATDENRANAKNRATALTAGSAASIQAGIATAFCDLASLKLKPGGRLGLVLPMTASLGDSWTTTRKMLEDEFDDITLLAYAKGGGGKDALSADTAMGEMMFTGIKRSQTRTGDEPRPNIVSLTIFKSFKSVPEAAETARAITFQKLHSKSQKDEGVIYLGGDQSAQWVRSPSVDGSWTTLGASSFVLVELADRLTLSGELVPLDAGHQPSYVPMTTVGKLFDVGHYHMQIGHPVDRYFTGAFEFHKIKKGAPKIKDLSLWATYKAKQISVNVEPTHYGIKCADEEKVEKIRSGASDLFYQKGMRWTSQKILVARTSRPVLGGRAWAALAHEDEAVKFGFAVYANSSLGMLVHWSRAARQHFGRSVAQIGAIKKIPCPDFTDSRLHTAASKLIAEQPDLLNLKLEQANNSLNDLSRSRLNAATAEMLGIEIEAFNDIAEIWCAEPSVKG